MILLIFAEQQLGSPRSTQKINPDVSKKELRVRYIPVHFKDFSFNRAVRVIVFAETSYAVLFAIERPNSIPRLFFKSHLTQR